MLDDKIKPDTLYAITMNEVGFFTSMLNHGDVIYIPEIHSLRLVVSF